MKNVIAILVFTFLAFSCGKEKGNMIVKGQIKGLKKGKLYLQKKIDKNIISVDSIELFGDDKFELSDNVESPEMYYLTFDGNKQEKKLLFFGEQGEITIYDNIEEFGWKPKISGSKNQKVLEEFNKVNDQFKLKRLDFIAKDIEARAINDTAEVSRLLKEYNKMLRKKFLFTTQFAVTHPDSEASPYIALAELFDASVTLSDTINKSLTDRVKQSKYGKELNTYVKSVNEKLKKQ